MSLRRIMAAALALLALGTAAVGEDTMDELRAIRKSAEDAIAQIEVPTPSPEPTSTPAPTPVPVYEPLEQGAKGENVKKLQEKLAALGYLTGSVDGNFGPKTMTAVQDFQRAAGLPADGWADQVTQAMLFGIEAPHTLEYDTLKYDKFCADPAAYAGTHVAFTGTVMQVLTDYTYEGTRGVYTVLRVALRQHAYDVVYVTMFRPQDDTPIQQGDSVYIRGIFMGMKAYQSVSGKSVILPWVDEESIH